MKSQPCIGVYICHCGVNIAATVDVAAVTAFAGTLPGVVVARDYTYMCSDPGQVLIKQDIAEFRLNRVVVASCSPWMHEVTFRNVVQDAGLNPYLMEMANIREQCSWVHEAGEATTEKAKWLVASAVAKAALLEPLGEREVEVTPAALVIGGGVAGMSAALDIADAGYKVILVEREPHLGGRAAQLHRTFPTLELVEDLVAPIIAAVTDHPNIEVLTGAQVVGVEGYIGNFTVTIGKLGNWETGKLVTSSPACQSTNLPIYQLPIYQSADVGAIIVATGFDSFDATGKPELGYGRYPGVITAPEFEQLAAKGGSLIIDGREPRAVAFIQCVGSRDKQVGNPYCSRICCMITARQAHLVRERLPEANITVFYTDVRAFGKGFEEYYDRVREEGVIYRRGEPSEVIQSADGERLVVKVEDTLLGEEVEVEADLVVLATGLVPRPDAADLARLLKLARSPDGFLAEAHPKLRPVDTINEGVFIAGACQGPKDIPDSITQAKAAAASAIVPLSQGRVKVESATCVIDDELCVGCDLCAAICPYGALSLDETEGVMTANSVLCKGCGACAVICPSNAITLLHFTPKQVLAQVEALMW
ncbi:MAG: CoB--CoM heterodisulfide reductase iron-sulfur subunit A family protein [Anaerolineae bacterium]